MEWVVGWEKSRKGGGGKNGGKEGEMEGRGAGRERRRKKSRMEKRRWKKRDVEGQEGKVEEKIPYRKETSLVDSLSLRLAIQTVDSKKLEFARLSGCRKKSQKPWELLGTNLSARGEACL